MLNPYRPPNSELKDRDASLGSSLTAVVVGGFVVDFLGTVVLGGAAGVAWSRYQIGEGQTVLDISRSLESSEFQAFSVVLGYAMTLLGGYVAPAMIGRSQLRHAAGAGAISLALVLPVFLFSEAGNSTSRDTLSAFLTIPVAMIGGAIAKTRAA